MRSIYSKEMEIPQNAFPLELNTIEKYPDINLSNFIQKSIVKAQGYTMDKGR